jgi:RimJ/RimL family protein N-acetyltransferase
VSPFDCTTITTPRLALECLRAEDADAMAEVLRDESLHELTGGRPLTVTELRHRYAELVVGSSNPDEAWLNWIVRRRTDSQPVGTVQATLTSRASGRSPMWRGSSDSTTRTRAWRQRRLERWSSG